MKAFIEAVTAVLSLVQLYTLIRSFHEKEPRNKAKIIRNILGLLALIAVFFYAYNIDENKIIIVDNYKELSQEEAVDLIENQNLVVKINEEYCYSVPSGIVFDQAPSTGTELHKGETIQLFVSLGPRPIVMPDYIGMTEKTAKTDASKYGFSVVTKTGYSSTYKEGTIYEQEPEPLSNCFEGDEIVLYISKGGEPKIVHYYIGMSKDAAIASIRDDNFAVNIVQEYNDEIEEGVVFKQSPKNGDKISEGSTITIYVSKGHFPIVLDNYIGQEADSAKEKAVELGLEVVLEEVENEDYEDGTVFDQMPKADTEIAYGGRLTLYIAIRNPYPGTYITFEPSNSVTYCHIVPWDSKEHKDILGFSTGNSIKITVTDIWTQLDDNSGSHIVAKVHMPFGSRFDNSVIFTFIPSEEMRGNRSFANITIIADGEIVFGGEGDSNRVDSSTTKALESTPISFSNIDELIIQFDCKTYDGGFAAGIGVIDL